MLRGYQTEICTRIAELFREHRSVMVQMPTGTGKTVVLAEVVKRFLENDNVRRVIVVAHRRELVEQIERTFDRVLNKHLGADEQRDGFQISRFIKVYSIQWLSRHVGSIDYCPSLVIIDEAHHALARTYRMMWEQWPEARFLGLTATPWRMNGKAFTDLFEVLVQSKTEAEFVKEGVLAKYDYFGIVKGSEEQKLIESLKKRGADGDYQQKEMNAVLNRRPTIERLFWSMKEFAKDKKGLVYAISIDHAKRIAEYYKEHGVHAEAISAQTADKERAELIEKFRNSGEDGGKGDAPALQVLVNVDIFSEGFDCPDVEFIQLARPTLSLAKYLQMVGRGLRKAHGKDYCVILDNVGLYRRFGLPTSPRDWQGYFEGSVKNRGTADDIRPDSECAVTQYPAISVQQPTAVFQPQGLELIVGHDELNVQMERQKESVEHASKERENKLRGTLRVDTCLMDVEVRGKIQKKSVKCVINGLGETVFKGGVDFVLTRDLFIRYKPHWYSTMYIDAKTRREYYIDSSQVKRPRVITMGWMEVVVFDIYLDTRCIHSVRTFDQTNIAVHGKCLLISGSRALSPKTWEKGFDRYCYLKGEDRPYRVVDEYYGNNYLVSDVDGYYHLNAGSGQKERIEIGEGKVLSDVREEMKKRYLDEEKMEKKRSMEIREKAVGCIEPYERLKKWGLKCGEDIVVEARYRRVRKPVGRFFAFEVYAMQWGVMDIHGNVIVEPKYKDVEIREDGTAVLTVARGMEEVIRLAK